MQEQPHSLPPGDCPLCGGTVLSDYHKDKRRTYLQCTRCFLVFVPKEFHLSEAEERAVYELHQNSPDDAGYRQFLSRLANPLLERLAPESSGLDFGCGPGPTLSVMLEERGHHVSVYDPYYAPDKKSLTRHYDFITATEVVEHLAAPGNEFKTLWKMLKPGGWLAMMTQLVIDKAAFSRWRYKDDPTHIAFFSKQTFEYVARDWGIRPDFIGKGVILFNKSGPHPEAPL